MRTQTPLTLALFAFGILKRTTFQFFAVQTASLWVTPESATLLDRGTEDRNNMDHIPIHFKLPQIYWQEPHSSVYFPISLTLI
jgi:hypothetical protein